MLTIRPNYYIISYHIELVVSIIASGSYGSSTGVIFWPRSSSSSRAFSSCFASYNSQHDNLHFHNLTNQRKNKTFSFCFSLPGHNHDCVIQYVIKNLFRVHILGLDCYHVFKIVSKLF